MADDRDARIAQLEAEVAALNEVADARDNALAEALEQQSATAEVLRVIAATPSDLDPVIATVVEAPFVCAARTAARSGRSRATTSGHCSGRCQGVRLIPGIDSRGR